MVFSSLDKEIEQQDVMKDNTDAILQNCKVNDKTKLLTQNIMGGICAKRIMLDSSCVWSWSEIQCPEIGIGLLLFTRLSAGQTQNNRSQVSWRWVVICDLSMTVLHIYLKFLAA